MLLAVAFGVSGCVSTAEIAARDGAIEPKTTVRVPDGPGPFPGVVVLHNCAGLDGPGASITTGWADFLVANGYAVALTDSFGPRNRIGGVCTAPGPTWVRPLIRGSDAHKGREALQAHPKVDKTRIGMMGGSNGGVAVLAAANQHWTAENRWTGNGGPGFRAAIAFYPECGIGYGEWTVTRSIAGVKSSGSYVSNVPMLILIGDADDWTPASACTNMLQSAAGEPIAMKVYPGAHHSFDNPAQPVIFNPRATNINRPAGGATVGYNAPAFADSKEQVLKFFGEKLRGGS